MYVPPHFEDSRPEQLHALIAHHPLGVLVTNGPNGLDANHLPFELETRGDSPGILHTHVARANPVRQDIRSGDEVLVVFRAADAYISPNWYSSKHEHHRQVPTWNYIVAHAHGTVTVCDAESYVDSGYGSRSANQASTQGRRLAADVVSSMRRTPAFADPDKMRSAAPVQIVALMAMGHAKKG